MRVAIITEVFLPKVDGVVNRTLNLIRHLPGFGDELLVVCPRAHGCTDCSVPVVDVPSFSFLLYPEYRIGLPSRRTAEAIKSFNPDVIHYVNPFAFGFRCHDVLRKAGVQTPSVFSFHTLYGEFVKQYKVLRPLSPLLWWLMREYHNRADVNLTVSGIMQCRTCSTGASGASASWPPAVDSDLFHPTLLAAAMRDRLGRPAQPTAAADRLPPGSGEERRLPGGRACGNCPTPAWPSPGDGPDRPALERRFAGLDARFVGYLKGEELASAYASADAFVYASETETMGNVVLEAMACGGAVVAPHAGGIPNLLQHGNTGFLYTPRDLADAVRHTRALLDDAHLRERVGQSARQAIGDSRGAGNNRSAGCGRCTRVPSATAARRRRNPPGDKSCRR